MKLLQRYFIPMGSRRRRRNINDGQKKYERHLQIPGIKHLKRANLLTARTIQMIRDNGFWEYFDPIDDGTKDNAKGMGFSSFSWTAAILIQLIHAAKLL